MGFTWYLLGLLTTGSTIFLWHFSKRYQFNWLSWAGLSLGIVLTLFSIAWSVGFFRYRHFNPGLSIHLNQKTEDA